MADKEEIEVEGKSAQEAIATALKKLRAKREEVEIKILSEETKGLFGMEGRKKAKVKVIIKERK
ncbi:MAG: Jag N-terminal domain-containing protein [Candidatus Omnitrophica bacterium]|nr:Jag N-terminal domain-containing protein [Candidatus Omnitrophota bacterium]